MDVHEELTRIALERGLRQSTVLSYRRLLGRMGLLELPVSQVTPNLVQEALWQIDNPNTRRSAVIACRAVLGLSIRIPKGVPRRYDLPDEDTLRLALITTPHEVRGLLMMYAGLRIGEACAVRGQDVDGDVLTIARQIQQLHDTGRPTTVRVGPTKTGERTAVIPWWLSERLAGLDGVDKPDAVRESLRRAGRKVGIHLNPHMLRHWYATTLLTRGVPISLVSQQMGHSDIAVTLRTYQQHNGAVEIHRAFE